MSRQPNRRSEFHARPAPLGSDLAEKGISVTTIGVGDDYNEDLMAGLAEPATPIIITSRTRKIAGDFREELATAHGRRREIRIEITCPDGVRPLGFIVAAEKFENQKAS